MREGIVQVTGGAAVFKPLTIAENLRAGAYCYKRKEGAERIERALDVFPMLAERRSTLAGELSGGQQHMLALALALMHDPKILIIDELSLGLAPIIVQQVVEVVRGLKTEAMTMMIVEQSVDVRPGHRRPGGVHGEGSDPLRRHVRGTGAAAGSAPRRVPGRVTLILAFDIPPPGGVLRPGDWCDLRDDGRRDHPHLPVDPGDQPGHCRHGRVRCRVAGPDGHQLGLPVLGGLRGVRGGGRLGWLGDRQTRHPTAVRRSAGDRVRGHHRRGAAVALRPSGAAQAQLHRVVSHPDPQELDRVRCPRARRAPPGSDRHSVAHRRCWRCS